MQYGQIVTGYFLDRPNRFIANVEVDGEKKICHVKNTGRCRELLTPRAKVILAKGENPNRKTEYDLVAVYKGDRLINLDSQAPNAVFGEWVKQSGYFSDLHFVRPECTYQNSRFDFYLEAGERKIFVEVKGVTLEQNGVVMFPDAPTLRGSKHLRELTDAVKNGYEAFVFFVIQMDECSYFTPNRQTDPDFANALTLAASEGVQLRAVTCRVWERGLEIDGFTEIRL